MYEYVSISQSVFVLDNHKYALNPEVGAKHFLILPMEPKVKPTTVRQFVSLTLGIVEMR